MSTLPAGIKKISEPFRFHLKSWYPVSLSDHGIQYVLLAAFLQEAQHECRMKLSQMFLGKILYRGILWDMKSLEKVLNGLSVARQTTEIGIYSIIKSIRER